MESCSCKARVGDREVRRWDDSLLGFLETLRTQSPTLLIEHAKAGMERYGAARQETVNLMQSLGYRAYRLRRKGMTPYDWERGRGDAFWTKSPVALT